MTVFTVLEPPDGKADRVAFVPEGFSSLALLFTAFWALLHRMWVAAALLFAASAVLPLAVAAGLLAPPLATLLTMAMALLFGFEARALQVLSLERAGFRRSGLISATGLEAAERIYFASRSSAAAAAPPSSPALRPPAAAPDTLGIFGNV